MWYVQQHGSHSLSNLYNVNIGLWLYVAKNSFNLGSNPGYTQNLVCGDQDVQFSGNYWQANFWPWTGAFSETLGISGDNQTIIARGYVPADSNDPTTYFNIYVQAE